MTSFDARERFLSASVGGAKEFSAALRRADKDLAKAHSAALRAAAINVRDEARRRYERTFRQGTSGRSWRTRTQIKHGFAQGVSWIGDRRGKTQWITGQEFGGEAARFDTPRARLMRSEAVGLIPQRNLDEKSGLRKIKWGSQAPGGTFLWPAAHENWEETTETILDAVDQAMNALRGRVSVATGEARTIAERLT